ncbi:transposase [Micrococcus luteus]|uniref:transposase n=1 Tax=Micrococcus luteus TaxID=1270 RepID=UPI00119D1DB0|nr:transposase [Micrococcus luteus]
MGVGVEVEGMKEVVGMWVEEREGWGLWGQVWGDVGKGGVEEVVMVWWEGVKGVEGGVVSGM